MRYALCALRYAISIMALGSSGKIVYPCGALGDLHPLVTWPAWDGVFGDRERLTNGVEQQELAIERRGARGQPGDSLL